MPLFAYAILAVGTILWVAPYPLVRTKRKGSQSLGRRARWGVALQAIGYTLLWQGSFWMRSPALWQTIASSLLFVAACALSWTGAFALGRQHRVDAALNADHKLIRSGPYRFVRHPIYASMLCVVAGTGILIAPLYLLAPGLAVFLAGTVIRMRVEDALLAARFGDDFRQYRRTVPQLIPYAW